AWLPDLLYTGGGRFESGLALVSDGAGRIKHLTRNVEDLPAGSRVVRLKGRALLPGLVNAHSHAFQRVIRGRTERRSTTHDSFWTWREMMYAAATRLTPVQIYDASRMAFLEMAASGISAVGEFHYLHHTPEGTRYADANELAKQVVRAARDVGIRIALLRVAYARSGWNTPSNARQTRFIERDAQAFLKGTEALKKDIDREASRVVERSNAVSAQGEAGGDAVSDARASENNVRASDAWVGVAPHSVRAVPLDYLREVCAFAAEQEMPVHMHVAEQPAEVAACLEEHGRTPVALLADEGLLGARFTAVHAVHITAEEARSLADAHAHVCACPTTERNLGDGIIPADMLLGAGVRVSLGTDSHTQIDLLEDARELEYHLRLQKLERALLAPAADTNADPRSSRDANTDDADTETNSLAALAARLFECATANGAASIGAPVGSSKGGSVALEDGGQSVALEDSGNGGALAVGGLADFFTVALDDLSIAGAGADDLLPAVVFSLARTAVRDTVVGGRRILEDGQHRAQDEIIERFTDLQRKLWQ
ncbi:MAG TPA: formimidoylglutamate deiminase, partial [Pyrinomonadaceae bacterium]|nr:formimidoylglutamate deiminase [Pyrinomonadaceae bacterium]